MFLVELNACQQDLDYVDRAGWVDQIQKNSLTTELFVVFEAENLITVFMGKCALQLAPDIAFHFIFSANYHV